ncbi:MAG: hypothetical protein WCY71_00925 [Halothiobacillaceae bacterium]|nr:hypothetical protein [Thiohalobacter sp.]
MDFVRAGLVSTGLGMMLIELLTGAFAMLALGAVVLFAALAAAVTDMGRKRDSRHAG